MRRKLDQYNTEQGLTIALLQKCPFISGTVFECCSGTGQMSSVFSEYGMNVITNDLDDKLPADHAMDMTKSESWERIRYSEIDFVITNPPFNSAMSILEHAYRTAKQGVALFLRLSFIEPTKDRTNFLLSHPPTQMIVMPRVSFTDDGKKDTVTCAWFIWMKNSHNLPLQPISIYPRKWLLDSASDE